MRFCRIKTSLAAFALLVVFSTGVIGAEGMDLEEIVYWGLENAPAQIEMKNELEGAIREIEKTLAGAGWQLNVRGLSNIDLKETEIRRQLVSLNLGRNFVPGINLQGSLSYGKGISGMVSGEAEYKPDVNLSVGYRVFPRTPSATERELISRKAALERVQNTFLLRQSQNILAWVEDYLTLARQEENLESAKKNLARVEEELEEVLRRKDIGEAGELNEIDSRVALLRAENAVITLEQAAARNRDSFYRALGLSKDAEILLNVDAELVGELWEWVESFDFEEMEREEKLEAAKKANPEFKNLQLELESFSRQVEWFEKEQKPRIDLSGNVDGWHDDWGAGIGIEINYNIFDSGRDNLQREDFRAQERDLEKRESDLEKDLDNQLQTLEDAVKTAKRDVEEKELLLKRSELELELKEESYQKGLATIRDYNQAVQNLQEAQLDYSEALDNLLISRLQLAYFLGNFIDWEQGVEK